MLENSGWSDLADARQLPLWESPQLSFDSLASTTPPKPAVQLAIVDEELVWEIPETELNRE